MGEIQFINVDKSFGEVNVLEQFNITLDTSKHYYIKGPSGCGKTTFLRLFMDLEKADSGQICGLEGYKLSAVFQENRLMENLSCVRNISLVSSVDKSLILEGLKKFGLEGFEEAKVSTLSGGMKRRVAILRGLLCDCDILLLDEPLKELDDDRKEIIIEEIRKRTKEKMLILVTHSSDEALKLGIVDNIINFDHS